jgi:hypothetical protein
VLDAVECPDSESVAIGDEMRRRRVWKIEGLAVLLLVVLCWVEKREVM